MSIYQTCEEITKFIGDFEVDLTPYYKYEATHSYQLDLRSFQAFRNAPNYMHKDMRKKGTIQF